MFVGCLKSCCEEIGPETELAMNLPLTFHSIGTQSSQCYQYLWLISDIDELSFSAGHIYSTGTPPEGELET
jgi:hypothetical protein